MADGFTVVKKKGGKPATTNTNSQPGGSIPSKTNKDTYPIMKKPPTMPVTTEKSNPAISKAKTVPTLANIQTGKFCAFFPLPQGCKKGEGCLFIHADIHTVKANIPRLMRFENACLLPLDEFGLCKNGVLCPFVHKNEGVAAPKPMSAYDMEKPKTVSPSPAAGKAPLAPAVAVKKHDPDDLDAPKTIYAAPGVIQAPKRPGPASWASTGTTSAGRTPSSSQGSVSSVSPLSVSMQNAQNLSGWNEPVSAKDIERSLPPSHYPPPPDSVPPPPPGYTAPPMPENLAVPPTTSAYPSEPAVPKEPAPPPPLLHRTFVVQTTAPAEGYLSANIGERVVILHEEDPEWFYGQLTSTGEAGWFPRENVAYRF